MIKKEVLSEKKYDIFDNDSGEIMLLMNAATTKPETPSFCFNEKEKTLELNRGEQIFILKSIKAKIIKEIKSIKELYVCEIDNTNTEVVYVYTANIAVAQSIP